MNEYSLAKVQYIYYSCFHRLYYHMLLKQVCSQKGTKGQLLLTSSFYFKF